MNINDIMKQITEKQFMEFKSQIDKLSDVFNGTIPRKAFVMTYLGTFLGAHAYFTQMHLKVSDNEFASHCTNVVNSISLCGPEIKYFIEMSGHIGKDGDYTLYIDNLLKMYDKTEDLSNCQLGYNMKRCLEHSKQFNYSK